MSAPGVFLRRRAANARASAIHLGLSEPIVAKIGVVWAEPPTPEPALLHGEVRCPTCDKPLKKRGAHFHTRKCKG